jgi:hypothetical protein
MTSNEVKQRIADVEEHIGSVNFMTMTNNKVDHCCYFCKTVINSMDFKTIATGRYECDRGIEYLVCGINCERVPESHKGRCCECDKVVDIGYYRDLPRSMLCETCTHTSKTCCYYCGDHIENIDTARTICDTDDNIKNLVCSFRCYGIPDEIKDNCAYCGTLFFDPRSEICSGCWCAEREM